MQSVVDIGLGSATGAVSDFTVQLFDSLEPLREEWSGLAAATGSVFSTWEWCSTWWRHFGGGRRLTVAACRSRDGRLQAILPLYQARKRPLSVVRLVGYGSADELRPICAPAAVAPACRALRLTLGRLSHRCDVFFGDQVPEEIGFASLVGGRRLKAIPSPVLELGGLTWDDFLRARRASRKRLRYLERRLESTHSVVYRRTTDPAALDRDLDTLFELHRDRWGASTFSEEEGFHRAFAPQALRADWLRLWIQEIDGQPSAAWYGFRYGDAVSYYQSGRDPRWARESVGFLLLLRTIKAAIEEGAGTYRFLRGGEAYKLRLTAEVPTLETVGVALNMRGALAVRVAAALSGDNGERLPRLYRRLAALAR